MQNHPALTERATRRAAVLARMSHSLQQDHRLAGAILVGSGATGFRDEESDIDLVAPVATAYDASEVFRDWKARIPTLVDLRYRSETAFTEQHQLLVLLCDDLLELDLSFPSLGSLVALRPQWQILWDRSGEVGHRMSLPPAASEVPVSQGYVWLVNQVVHRVVYAAKALRHGQVWKALLLIDQLRSRVLQLACLDVFGELYADVLGDAGVERHVWMPYRPRALRRSGLHSPSRRMSIRPSVVCARASILPSCIWRGLTDALA